MVSHPLFFLCQELKVGSSGIGRLLASRNPLYFKVIFLLTHSYGTTKFLHLFLHSQEMLAAAGLTCSVSSPCCWPQQPASCTGSWFQHQLPCFPRLLVLSSRGDTYVEELYSARMCALLGHKHRLNGLIRSLFLFSALPFILWSEFQGSFSSMGIRSSVSCFSCFWMTSVRRK